LYLRPIIYGLSSDSYFGSSAALTFSMSSFMIHTSKLSDLVLVKAIFVLSVSYLYLFPCERAGSETSEPGCLWLSSGLQCIPLQQGHLLATESYLRAG
jgi:hypothetical protein